MHYKTLKALAFTTALVTVGAAASAETTLKIASVAPTASPWGQWVTQVSQAITEASGGELKFELLLDAQAGDEQTIIRQATRGRIDMAFVSNSALSLIVPEASVMGAPYLFDSIDQGSCVIHEHLTDTLGQLMTDAGLHSLTWMEVGNNVVFSKTPVAVPADMEGMKVRVAPTVSDNAYATALHIAGVPMGTSDTIPALQTGAVDGAWFPTVFGIAIGTFKVAPNVTVTNHSRLVGTLAISQEVWDGLTAQEQEWLGAFTQAGPAMTQAVLGAEGALLGQIAGAGVPVHYLTPEEEALWRASGEGVEAQIIAEAGGKSQEVADALDAAKLACAN